MKDLNQLMKILSVDKMIRWDYTKEEKKWLKIQLWMLVALVAVCCLIPFQ